MEFSSNLTKRLIGFFRTTKKRRKILTELEKRAQVNDLEKRIEKLEEKKEKTWNWEQIEKALNAAPNGDLIIVVKDELEKLK